MYKEVSLHLLLFSYLFLIYFSAFFKLGYQLFNDTPEEFPVPFVEGDILNTAFLNVVPPVYKPSEVQGAPPDLSKLTTLTPLAGQLTAIHISMVFHLFMEDKQLHLARAIAGLLAPTPGAMIFGWHSGEEQKGFMTGAKLPNGDTIPIFCHSEGDVGRSL